MIRRPPRSTRTDTLFPYTTLFRSALREDPNAPGNESWTNRAVAMEYVGRSGTDSCSPVGGGGFTGCFSKLMREARADRMGSDNISWARLVEAERQKRLEKLDAEAAAIEEIGRAHV